MRRLQGKAALLEMLSNLPENVNQALEIYSTESAKSNARTKGNFQ